MRSLKYMFGRVVPVFEQGLVSAANFGIYFFSARNLPQEALGQLGLMLGAFMVCVVVSVGLVFQHATNEVVRKGFDGSYLRGLYFLNVITIIFMAKVALFIFLASTLEIRGQGIVFTVFVFFLSQQMVDSSRRMAYVCGDDFDAFKVSVFVNIPRIFLLFFLEWESLVQLCAILCVTSVYGVCVFWLKFYKYHKYDLEIGIIAGHIKATGQLLWVAPLSWFWNYLHSLFLSIFVGIGAVGVFAAVRSVANFLNIFLELIETKYAAGLARKRIYSHSAGWKVISFFIPFVFFVLYFLYDYGGLVLAFALGDEFASEKLLLILFLVLQLSVLVLRKNCVHLRKMRAYFDVVKVYILGVVSAIPLCYVLVEMVGMIGVALSLILSSLIMIFVSFAFLRKRDV